MLALWILVALLTIGGAYALVDQRDMAVPPQMNEQTLAGSMAAYRAAVVAFARTQTAFSGSATDAQLQAVTPGATADDRWQNYIAPNNGDANGSVVVIYTTKTDAAPAIAGIERLSSGSALAGVAASGHIVSPGNPAIALPTAIAAVVPDGTPVWMAQAYGVTALSSVRTRTPTSGFALVELLAALAILGLLLAGVASMINTSLQDAKGQQTASYQAALATAAAKVVANNASALLDSATATTPVVIGLTTATNPSYALSTYLPDGIGTRNAYGQTPCLLVYANAAHTMLQGLLVTEGGVSISDDALGYIAGNAGQGGGSIPATNNASGAALGAFGTWSVATPNPSGKSCSGTVTGVGHLVNEVTTNATNAQDADFLYRVAVPGDPTANAMQVPLILAKETLGAACTAATGAIAADDQNHVLSCVAGTWQPVPLLHWRDPVVNATDLSAMTNPQTGDVAMTTATGRAYTFNGASWQALAVDENGVLALGNQETVGAACAATQASTTPVSTDAKGRVLSCQNGTWQTQSEVLPALNVVGCETIMSSPGATDYTCTTVPNAWTINTTNNTYTTIHTETVTLNKAGMISASSWAHMNDGVCEGNGVMGTGHNAQESQSLDVFDSSGNTLSHTESMGPTLKDDSGGINNTLNTAQNAGTYTVQVTTNWATYAGITTPWTSSYCDTAGNPISNSPLVAGWSVNTYY